MMMNLICFFQHCPFDNNERCTLLRSLRNINHELLDNTQSYFQKYYFFSRRCKEVFCPKSCS